MEWVLYIAFWAAFLWVALYDLKYRIIPDSGNLIIGLSGIVLFGDLLQALIGGLLGGGLLLIMALINQNWVGGGDIKLLFALGLTYGTGVMWILWVSCLFALVFSLVTRKKSLPFAPFVFFATSTIAVVSAYI